MILNHIASDDSPNRVAELVRKKDYATLCDIAIRQPYGADNFVKNIRVADIDDAARYRVFAQVVRCAQHLNPESVHYIRKGIFNEFLSKGLNIFAVDDNTVKLGMLRDLEKFSDKSYSLEKLILSLPEESRDFARLVLDDKSSSTIDVGKVGRSVERGGDLEKMVSLAYVLNRRGNLDEATRYYQMALSICNDGEQYTGFTRRKILTLAIDAAASNRDYLALSEYIPEFERRYSDDDGWESYSLGNAFLRMREYDSAKEYLSRAEKWAGTQKDPQEALVAWTYHKYSDVYAEIGDFERSIDYARKGLLKFRGIIDDAGVKWCNLSLARSLTNRGSKKDIKEAIKILRQFENESEEQNVLIHARFHLGKAYLRSDEHGKAAESFKHAANYVNHLEQASIRKNYDLFLAEYFTGLSIVASGRETQASIPYFRRAQSHITTLEETLERAGCKNIFQIEELACKRFTNNQEYLEEKMRLESVGESVLGKGVAKELMLDKYKP